MEYRAVSDRIAVDLNSLNLPISNQEAFHILLKKGFEAVNVDIISAARTCIGKSIYRRGAKVSEALAVVDCSSFVKYLYSKRGIWIPRRSIQQFQMGASVDPNETISGDLIFVSGFIDYYINDPLKGIGHVGIITGDKTVIHAANKKVGVIETPLKDFTESKDFRGIKRLISKNDNVFTLKVPSHRVVETSDDLRWIILQSFKREVKE